MALGNEVPGTYLHPRLWGGQAFGAALLAEAERWRAATGETPSGFAPRLGVAVPTYLRWREEGAQIPAGIGADALWRVLGALLERRRQIADEAGLVSLVQQVDAAGEPLDLERVCPVCGQNALQVSIRSRVVRHSGPWRCALNERGFIDLLDIAEVVASVQGQDTAPGS